MAASILARRPLLGIAAVLFVATSFAIGSTLARVAYDNGADALSANATRIWVGGLILGIILIARGEPVRLAPRERAVALALGLLLAAYTFGLYKSFETIPVPVGVLVFYTYPLFTAVVAWALGDERPTPRAVAALLLGFAGLTLALDATGKPVPLSGVAHAGAASLGFTALLTLNGRLFRGRDSRPVTAHMLGSASLAYVVICLAVADYAAPQAPIGWLALAGVAISYTAAAITLFAAVAAIGPTKTALIMNVEPVASIALSAAILGQRLSAVQLAGAALVIAALFLVRKPAPR
jgi:drug/metabolite transporter (DMT)-like permease